MFPFKTCPPAYSTSTRTKSKYSVTTHPKKIHGKERYRFERTINFLMKDNQARDKKYKNTRSENTHLKFGGLQLPCFSIMVLRQLLLQADMQNILHLQFRVQLFILRYI